MVVVALRMKPIQLSHSLPRGLIRSSFESGVSGLLETTARLKKVDV